MFKVGNLLAVIDTSNFYFNIIFREYEIRRKAEVTSSFGWTIPMNKSLITYSICSSFPSRILKFATI